VPSPTSEPRLLEAAKRTFAAHGYGGATLERIATEAGVSRVTLHRRGVSKDGLLAELIVTRPRTTGESCGPR
jgi:AcrR family transcriptional regulator